jgi:S1-C subfamily serine protease
MTKNSLRRITGIAAVFAAAVIMMTQCKTPGEIREVDSNEVVSSGFVVDSTDIQDYVCVVNLGYHPNIDRFLKNRILELMESGDFELDDQAAQLETVRRGGFGSGFVYVDKDGNNFIITNYHVVEGAYRFSVSFMDENGKPKYRFANLSVLNVDRENDLAVLAFPPGDRPFRRGLTINAGSVRLDASVKAAGYPGMPRDPVWSFTSGTVSNAHMQISGEPTWYIQHSATIHPGNSGGPLLIPDTDDALGYQVVGVNAAFFGNRPGTFLSISSGTLVDFLQKTFAPADNERILREQVASFIDLLNSSEHRLVYEEIAPFLSNTLIASDPQGAWDRIEILGEEFDISSKIKSKFTGESPEPITGIAWAVAFFNIEFYTYLRDLNVQAERGDIARNDYGGYTAILYINNIPYRTEWVKEYGTWLIDDYVEDDGEYNDTGRFATALPLGRKTRYTLSSYLDYDWYSLDIPHEGKLTVYTEGDGDPKILVCYNPFTTEAMRSTLIGENDDIDRRNFNFNARVQANVRKGTVYVRVDSSGSIQNPEDYTICAELE